MASSLNDLAAIIPPLMAGFLEPVTSLSPFIDLCDRRYEPVARQQGDDVTISVSSNLAARNVTPSVVPQETQALRTRKISLPLSNWVEVPFTLDGKEVQSILEGSLPVHIKQAGYTLRDAVEASLAATYSAAWATVGTAGITPFATTPDVITQAGQELNINRAFMNNRAVILDPAATARAQSLPAFQYYLNSGSTNTQREGDLGMKFGFQMAMGQIVQTHTAGDAAGRQVAAVTPVGSTSFTLGAAGAGSLVVGDVFRVAGDSGNYVVTALPGGGVVNFFPRSRVAWAAAAAITVTPSHVANLAFQREAIALVTALPDDPLAKLAGASMIPFVEPRSGLAFTIEFVRQNHQTVCKVSSLWGARMVRPEFACRILG